MTKQTRRPGMGLYFMIISVLLMFYFLFAQDSGAVSVTYAEVLDLFQAEQVESFYVRNGNELFLLLDDGTTARNVLGDVDHFREDLGPLIARQKAAGTIKDYDFAPVETPAWWSEILLYALLIGGMFFLWQFMAMRAQGGGGMDQGKKFGRAKIRFGADSQEKVGFDRVAGADVYLII